MYKNWLSVRTSLVLLENSLPSDFEQIWWGLEGGVHVPEFPEYVFTEFKSVPEFQ